MEYCTENWLRKAGDEIGKTIKVDITTLATTRGRFAKVCIEIDLGKPLRSRCTMRGREWRLQYEGLHDMCYMCEKYRHQQVACPKKTTSGGSGGTDKRSEDEVFGGAGQLNSDLNGRPEVKEWARRSESTKGGEDHSNAKVRSMDEGSEGPLEDGEGSEGQFRNFL